jgi:hypothetical protein
MAVKGAVFWLLTLRSSERIRRFGGTPQSSARIFWFLVSIAPRFFIWRRYIPLRRRAVSKFFKFLFSNFLLKFQQSYVNIFSDGLKSGSCYCHKWSLCENWHSYIWEQSIWIVGKGPVNSAIGNPCLIRNGTGVCYHLCSRVTNLTVVPHVMKTEPRYSTENVRVMFDLFIINLE